MKTSATIQVDDHGVKTYHYEGIDYGIDASKSSFRDGNHITVYFLKDKPYIVAENPYVYHSKLEIIAPLLWFFILLGFGILSRYFKKMNHLLDE